MRLSSDVDQGGADALPEMVCPPIAAALVAANVADLAVRMEAAE